MDDFTEGKVSGREDWWLKPSTEDGLGNLLRGLDSFSPGGCLGRGAALNTHSKISLQVLIHKIFLAEKILIKLLCL